MEKMAKMREIPEKSHDPNPAEIMLFRATHDFLKIETWAKMHQNYPNGTLKCFLFDFHSTFTQFLLLLLKEMCAATLHGTASLYY